MEHTETCSQAILAFPTIALSVAPVLSTTDGQDVGVLLHNGTASGGGEKVAAAGYLLDGNTNLWPSWMLPRLDGGLPVVVYGDGGNWCDLDTGYTTIKDGRGLRHTIFISLTKDGGLWARLGADRKSQDWMYREEADFRFQTTIIDQDSVDFLRAVNYLDYCVLTDLTVKVWAEGGWHPSYLTMFDPETKETRVISFKLNDGCFVQTAFSLSRDKQGLFCDGGKRNTCGLRNLPERRHVSHTAFIQVAKLDPSGVDRVICETGHTRNQYTFYGSYYHVYVKLADCPAPWESRDFGHEAKLRAFPADDGASDMIIIPDPTQTSLSDGVIKGWQVFAKIVSIQHEVYLQVWRPLQDHENIYSLVGQTYYKPVELRFHEVLLSPAQQIRIRKGDVLGLYFPKYNPVAWSTVPCAYEMQRFRYIESPSALDKGMAKQFNAPGDGWDACRQYSFKAVFANKTDAKLIDDWICPTWDPPLEMRRRTGEQRRKNSYQNDFSTNNDVMSETPTRRRHPPINNAYNGIIPLHLILIIVGCLILMLILIGFISYYRAVKS